MVEYERKRKWAVALLLDLAKVRKRAALSPKSTAAYWNGDDWGSISGIKEAAQWVEDEMINCVVGHADKLKENDETN